MVNQVSIGPMVNYLAAEVPPPRGGLYTAANVVERPAPARLAGGMNLIATNCGEHGVNAIDCGPTNDAPDGVLYVGDGPGLGEGFPAVEVWAADDCDFTRTGEEAAARANHLLALSERTDVERHVATVLADRAGALTSTTGGTMEERIIDAISLAEGLLGGLSLPGVLHIPARLAIYVKKAGGATWQANQAYSPLGHRIAFGGGYDEMGDAMYVTGPVTVLRSPVSTLAGDDRPHNERLTVASREVAVGWECLTTGYDLGGLE
jgi:hypothetical protein